MPCRQTETDLDRGIRKVNSAVRASVIIPVYNGSRTIAHCLDALSAQSVPRSEYEIIVINDASTDATARIVSFFPVRVLSQPHRGPAAARNLGVREAKADIVLFTDADTEPTPNWIETMLAPFGDRGIAGAKGTYRTRQREWVARFVQVEYEEKYARMARAKKVDVVDTYSAAYRREVALFDGGFDESFPSASAEDAEFSFRLARHGYRFVFLPDAIVYHRHAASLATYCRRKFKIGYWRIRVHQRHPGKLVSDAHTPPTEKLQVLLTPFLLGSALASLVLPGSIVVFYFFAVWFGLTMFPLTWRVVRRDPMVGLVSPLFIVCRAFALGVGGGIGLVSEVIHNSLLERLIVSMYRRSKSYLSPG